MPKTRMTQRYDVDPCCPRASPMWATHTGRPQSRPRRTGQLLRSREQLAAAEHSGAGRAISRDRHDHLLVERAIVVVAALRMSHVVAGLERHRRGRIERITLAGVPD